MYSKQDPLDQWAHMVHCIIRLQNCLPLWPHGEGLTFHFFLLCWEAKFIENFYVSLFHTVVFWCYLLFALNGIQVSVGQELSVKVNFMKNGICPCMLGCQYRKHTFSSWFVKFYAVNDNFSWNIFYCLCMMTTNYNVKKKALAYRNAYCTCHQNNKTLSVFVV